MPKDNKEAKIEMHQLISPGIKTMGELSKENKDQLIEIMQGYQSGYNSKLAVMKSMLDYVKTPTKEKWQNVLVATATNPGWDKSFISSSRVKALFDELKNIPPVTSASGKTPLHFFNLPLPPRKSITEDLFSHDENKPSNKK